MVVAILTFGQRIKNARETALKAKVDCTQFDEFKAMTNKNLERKLDTEIFKAFEKDVWEDLKDHKNANDIGFSMLQAELKEWREVNIKTMTHLATIAERLDNLKELKSKQ
jgi:hypothetical protein